jgi:hypothetical protein
MKVAILLLFVSNFWICLALGKIDADGKPQSFVPASNGDISRFWLDGADFHVYFRGFCVYGITTILTIPVAFDLEKFVLAHNETENFEYLTNLMKKIDHDWIITVPVQTDYENLARLIMDGFPRFQSELDRATKEGRKFVIAQSFQKFDYSRIIEAHGEDNTIYAANGVRHSENERRHYRGNLCYGRDPE